MGISLLMFVIGFFLIGIGLSRLKKPFSASFFARTPYTIASAYGAIPLGLAALCFGIAFFPFVTPAWSRFLFPTGLVIGLIGTIIAVTFLKPSWLKWLEQEHKSILPILENEAWEIGLKALDQQINSRQDLEAWVAEVRHKYGR